MLLSRLSHARGHHAETRLLQDGLNALVDAVDFVPEVPWNIASMRKSDSFRVAVAVKNIQATEARGAMSASTS